MLLTFEGTVSHRVQAGGFVTGLYLTSYETEDNRPLNKPQTDLMRLWLTLRKLAGGARHSHAGASQPHELSGLLPVRSLLGRLLPLAFCPQYRASFSTALKAIKPALAGFYLWRFGRGVRGRDDVVFVGPRLVWMGLSERVWFMTGFSSVIWKIWSQPWISS